MTVGKLREILSYADSDSRVGITITSDLKGVYEISDDVTIIEDGGCCLHVDKDKPIFIPTDKISDFVAHKLIGIEHDGANGLIHIYHKNKK